MSGLLGIEAVVSDDTIRRLFASLDPKVSAQWVAQAAKPIWGALPETMILDWDSTVQSKYGHQEGAEIGYNPRKPGRPHFLFKLKLTSNVRRVMAALPADSWQGPPQRGVLQVAEGRLRLPGWSRERRVVFGRRLLGVVPKEKSGTFWEENHHEFKAYIIAARLVQSGRQKVLQFCASGEWWNQLRDGYRRLCRWLEATAPQLGKPPHGLPDFSPLQPQFLTSNCGN